MNTGMVNRRWVTAICLSTLALGTARGAESEAEAPLRLQAATAEHGFDEARLTAVGKAIGFLEWPQSDTRRVGLLMDSSLLGHPELLTQESTHYRLVEFSRAPWAESRWSGRRLVENTEPVPTELPADRKERLLAALPPQLRGDPVFVEDYLKRKLERYQKSRQRRLDGEVSVRICLAPSSKAAQEHMLLGLIANTLPTDGLVRMCTAGRRPEGLGPVSLLTESSQKDDVSVRFARDNVCVTVRAWGRLADEALPLAHKLEAMLTGQPPLTDQQLLDRRPAVVMAPSVDGAPTEAEDGKSLSYDISVPAGTELAHVRASVDGQLTDAGNGRINLAGKRGTAKVTLTAITSELFVTTLERELDLGE